MKQTTFASMAYDKKKRQTRRERFLAEMEQVVPWAELVGVIEPFCPKIGKRGRPRVQQLSPEIGCFRGVAVNEINELELEIGEMLVVARLG